MTSSVPATIFSVESAFRMRAPDRLLQGRDPTRSHDIRHLLASVCLAADELELAPNARTRLLAKRILRAADRMIEVNESGPRTRSGAQESTGRLSDVLADVEAVARGLANTTTTLKVTVTDDVDCQDHAPHVFRILMNLVINSLNAVNDQDDGYVHVNTAKWVGRVYVKVADNGPGLFATPPTLARKQPLHDADRPDLRRSAGIGIPIAEMLAARHGMSLDILQTGRAGTCFALGLPSDHGR